MYEQWTSTVNENCSDSESIPETETGGSSTTFNKSANIINAFGTDSRDSIDDFDTELHPPQTKKRKIHMNSEQCHSHASSSGGGSALTNPMQVQKSSKVSNRGLYPRQPRIKKLKGKSHFNRESDTEQSYCNVSAVASIQNTNNVTVSLRQPDSGFVSASSVLKQNNAPISSWQPEIGKKLTKKSKQGLVNLGQNSITSFFKSESKSMSNGNRMVSTGQEMIEDNSGGNKQNGFVSKKGKRNVHGQVEPGQNSITSFFTCENRIVKTPQKVMEVSSGDNKQICNNTLASEDNACSLIEYGTPTKMYCPIKKLASSRTIYISDSPCSSQTTAESSSTNEALTSQSQKVIKQLFEGQKALGNGSVVNNKKSKGKRTKYNTSKNKLPPKSLTSLNSHPQLDLMKRHHDYEDLNSSDDDVLSSAVENASSQKFGLFGSFDPSLSHSDINYIDRLPDEVLQLIFCHLPLLDLCLNSNRVCRRWNNIISHEKFLKYKKLYHKQKRNVGQVRTEILRCMSQNQMCRPSEFLTGLIRYAKTCHTLSPSTNDNVLKCLQKHAKYSWAIALIKERLPELLTQEVPNPCSLIATLIVISKNVADVQEIIKCLSVPHSMCTSADLLECLYQIATLLYAFKLTKNRDVWNGMHYRLFYALYLYENSSSVSYKDIRGAASLKSGQQSMDRYSRSDCIVRLTHEQVRIVNHNCQPGEIIKIVAFAGTGKTTTLVRYTQMRPQMKFLLVVYNRSVCDDANTKFPANVTCKTGHGLSYSFFGRQYKAAGKMKFDLKVYTVSQLLPSRKGDNLFIRAKFVLDTINNFLSSDKEEILVEHVPNERLDESGVKVTVDITKKDLYVKDADYLWKRMVDLNDKDVPMTHDGYLKLYQLSKPNIWNYNCILIDEAQDLTPAITDILMSQSQTKILVGDPHQQIYSFRGAVNAMQQVIASHVFYLTQSFRFGPEIAQVAATCLDILKNENQKTLVGNGQPCKITGEAVGQVALLARCNFTLFTEAVKKCCYSESDIKVAFVGGINGFGFPMLKDIYTLMLSPEDRAKENMTIENKFIRKFHSLGDLEKYAAKTNDSELMGKIKIVRTYHHNLPTVVRKILSKTIENLKTADMVFSTAHKAKGLEFSTVRLTDDYNISHALQSLLRNQNGMLSEHREIPKDESNLLYVAVTRAKHALQLTSTINSLLSFSGEQFVYPILSSHLAKNGVDFKCLETDAKFEPYALTLQRQSVKFVTNEVLAEGVIGPAAVSENYSSFTELLGNPKIDICDVEYDNDDDMY